MDFEVIHADCRDAIQQLIDRGVQVDSIVTDPPYELGFMGKDWDRTGIAYQRLMWKMCFDLLKPGGHLLSFGGSRTYHRMACAIEDAGFEVRDQIMWVYGQGFPKSLDISKAIDKMAGAERERYKRPAFGGTFSDDNGTTYGTAISNKPETEAAKQWQGFGTALKPAHEPIVLARKPLSEKTIAENVLKHGTGAINVDGCRVETRDKISETPNQNIKNNAYKLDNSERERDTTYKQHMQGRFPANLIHDGSDEVEDEFAKYGERKSGYVKPKLTPKKNSVYGKYKQAAPIESIPSSSGSASRFFYAAKASKKDRNGSKHPTVKPIALMRYLCRLITPPNGTVLDPFAGSGTTGQAALDEGFKVILIEKEDQYIMDIQNRLNKGEVMSDVFRKEYLPLHEKRKELINEIKDKAASLYGSFEYVNDREMSLAKTNLEQAVMWATKSISNNPGETIGEPA